MALVIFLSIALMDAHSKINEYQTVTKQQNDLLHQYDEFSGELLTLSKNQQQTMDELVSMVPTGE